MIEFREIRRATATFSETSCV